VDEVTGWFIIGAMTSGSEYRMALVAAHFHRARRRAAIESLLSRLSGRPADLLSFDEVIGKLGVRGASSLGVQQIPVKAIIGSVGRYKDFTRTFLPRLESDEDRWIRVGAAAPTVAQLPPIDVYKIGDSYFVLDGNHRVSLARQQSLTYIDAQVVEVKTRAPLPRDARPDDLIIAAEHASFLEHTRLDFLRPDADMRVSAPGQYVHMENHIEAYRFVLETSEERELPEGEAVTRWYDYVYLPLVEAIREQGILRYFPGRTEADFFVWLSRHRAALQNELGIAIAPDVTVTRLLARVIEAARDRPSIPARLRQLVHLSPPGYVKPPPRTWAEERKLGRYSDHLFADVLFPIVISKSAERTHSGRIAYELAREIAAREGAHLHALCLVEHPGATVDDLALADKLSDETGRENDSQALTELIIDAGDPRQRTLDLAYLYDLIVMERGFDAQSSEERLPTASVRAIISGSTRPLLVVKESDGGMFANRALLIHDTRRRFDEALFIAAYLAEQWQVKLAVLPISNGRNTEEIVARISDYLALHEISPLFLEAIRPTDRVVEHIVDVALAGDYDLMVLSGPGRDSKVSQHDQLTDKICAILQRWPHSVLIAA
jgi:hypothetical protein